MPIQITGVDAEFSLEDAVAYEFFMEHVSILFGNENLDKDEVADSIAKLATASYMLGAMFSQTREQHIEKTNVEN
jgi:hypothetical protein